MTIGVDASMLVYQGSGVARYTYNLIKHALLYDKKNHYKIFYSSLRRPKNIIKIIKEFRTLGAAVYDYPFPPRLLEFFWNEHHVLPVEFLIGKVDVFHSSDFLRPPLLKGTRGITTIHDLTWKIYPEYHTEKLVRAHERKLMHTVQFNDTIIADSFNTKKDIMKFYPEIPEESIHVIYLGVEDMFCPISDKKAIAKVLGKYDIPYPANYLIYVGAIEPRKNVDRSIEVFAELIQNKGYEDFKFLIVGRAGWKNETVFNLVKRLKLQDKVIFVGYVEDEDLPYFYNASRCLMYLSEYEGFGLPPVEAGKCGIPTLLYKNSSLEELFSNEYFFANVNNEQSALQILLDTPIKISNYLLNSNWKENIKLTNSIFINTFTKKTLQFKNIKNNYSSTLKP